MIFAFKEIAIVFISVILAMGAAVALVVIGYWMGRNTTERPFRSQMNPKKALRLRTNAPKPEPDGDLFQDAAYGVPTYDPSKRSEPGISTIKR
jgi:hypothetical protein